MPKYKFIKELGKGAFGEVIEVVDEESNNKSYAIKRILKKKIISNRYLHEAFWKEIDIMKKLNCKNSVHFYSFFQSPNNYNVVMELCDEDLFKYIKNKKNLLSIEEVRNILLQLNNVFKLMASQRIMHRDLKPQNIMIKFLNKEKTEYLVKLADYGFSKSLENKNLTNSYLGTPFTMAPEVLQRKEYFMKADLWSVGIIIYLLLFKDVPYSGNNELEILKQIISNKPLKKCSNNLLNDLINKLLVVDPNLRIGWNDYFNHPFFNFGLNEIQEKKKERFKIINQILFDFKSDDFLVFIGKDYYNNQNVIIKQYSISFSKRYNKQIQNEIKISKFFIYCKYALHFKFSYQDDNYFYLIYDYCKGIPLLQYALNNDLSEDFIRNLNIGFYNNIVSYMKLTIIHFPILCTYNFMINEKYNLILFDFGLIKYVLPELKSMEFYLSSPSEMNEISMKSNILTYGFTLAKIFNRNKEITIKDKSLNLSTEKNMSDNFNNFLKKCLKKNKLKRYCYRDFPLDPFILNNSKENEALLTSSRLDSIISILENKFESILSYYEEIITKIKNIAFLNMIQLFLIISSKELEIIHKIFSKIEKKNDKFELKKKFLLFKL